MKIFFLVAIILLFGACSSKPQVPLVQKIIVIEKECIQKPIVIPKIPKKKKVIPPVWISQNPQDYSKNFKLSDLNISQEKYESDYFTPWNIKDPANIELNILWALEIYNAQNSYGENLQKREKSFFDEMREKINLKEYPLVNKKAMTLKHLNIRALPTNKPLLLNPQKAGEGFPFDYLQNSTISPNKPVLITHYSKDKAWAHIVSSFAYGWVKSDELALLTNRQTKEWQHAKQIFITHDNTALYSLKNQFLYKAKLGMILPLIKEDDSFYTVLTVAKYKMQKPLFVKVKVSKKDAHKGAIDFNVKNVNNILEQLTHSKYGWGGIYNQRDCSSTLRDFFAPFGIWLPRNSYKQSQIGEIIDLQNLSDDEKIKLIKEKAIPYRTLLYKKGHIVLYIGIDKNQIILFQNMWGIKTKENGKEGRYIVGKALFSTLKFGNNVENYDKDSALIHSLKSMNILF